MHQLLRVAVLCNNNFFDDSNVLVLYTTMLLQPLENNLMITKVIIILHKRFRSHYNTFAKLHSSNMWAPVTHGTILKKSLPDNLKKSTNTTAILKQNQNACPNYRWLNIDGPCEVKTPMRSSTSSFFIFVLWTCLSSLIFSREAGLESTTYKT